MSSTIPIDELHAVLADPRRRRVLDVLATRESPSLDDLARAVAEREANGRSVGADDPANVDRVRLTLHHCHLPRLAAAGIVYYDAERRRVIVRELPETERLRPESDATA